MMAAHVTERQMAARLGVSQSTISRDVHSIRASWRAHATRDYEKLVAEENAKLDVLEQAWFEKATVELDAVDRVLRIMERRARLLGLDRPTRSASTVTVVEDVEVLRARALELISGDLARRRALRQVAENGGVVANAEIVL